MQLRLQTLIRPCLLMRNGRKFSLNSSAADLWVAAIKHS